MLHSFLGLHNIPRVSILRFIYSSLDGHLLSHAAVNICVHIYLGYIRRGELPGHMVSMFSFLMSFLSF